jgi:hypothetical protein
MLDLKQDLAGMTPRPTVKLRQLAQAWSVGKWCALTMFSLVRFSQT